MYVGKDVPVFYVELNGHSWRIHGGNTNLVVLVDSKSSRHSINTSGMLLSPDKITHIIQSGLKNIREIAEESDVPESLIEAIVAEWGNTYGNANLE